MSSEGMLAMLTVRTLMTSVVLTLSIGDTLAQAEAHLKRNNFRHLPVVDGLERLVGLVTHRMVLAAWVGRLEPRFERPGDVASKVPIEMIMEREVVSVSPDTPAADAAGIMIERKFGCLPVVENGKLVGILTETDFLRYTRLVLESQAS